MLSIKILTRQNVARVANYYSDGADDYYAKDGNAREWQGRGAAILGLAGEVEPERFKELLAGKISETVQVSRGTIRNDAKERIGMDLTFSAPKSVSLQALVGGDVRVIAAHDKAVAAAIADAETRALARNRSGGKASVETTGNLVVAKFRHETSRDRDPQLHSHAIVMNLTQRADGEWRALKNDQIVKSLRHLGAVYRAELAAELQALGYELRLERGGSFELAHISREKIEAFSKRGAAIEAVLAAKGLNRDRATTAQKQAATMATRSKKKDLDRDAIAAEWQDRARDLGIDFDSRSWDGAGRSSEDGEQRQSTREIIAAAAVRYAIDHLTERQSIMDGGELVETAMKHAVHRLRAKDVEQEMRRLTRSGLLIEEAPRFRPADDRDGTAALTRAEWTKVLKQKGLAASDSQAKVDRGIKAGRLVAATVRCTTQTALARERAILNLEKQGRGAVSPLLSAEAAQTRLAKTDLNPGQRNATQLILSTSDRVVGVQGSAGVGKSHMLTATKTAIEAEGFKVRALAPYSGQVKTLREIGVDANTLASFLRATDKKIDARTVVFLDESGVVPTRQMEHALRIIADAGGRVVLIGDKGQTKAIEAGRPFDQLQAAGMATATMTEIRRQKDPILKAAVELAAIGQAAKSLERLNSVIEIAEQSDRRQRLVADYLALPAEQRETALILAGTNEARQDLNIRIRTAVGTAGTGMVFETLRRRDTTQAERRFSKNYGVDDYVMAEKSYKNGLQRGDLYRVLDIGPGNRLTVVGKSDERIAFSPMQTNLSVYQLEKTELALGDMVKITRNDAALDLATGERLKIIGVEAKALILEGRGRRVAVPAEKPLHLDHAYATTVHSAQGLTADRVFIEADTKSRTTAKDVYYVAISRARHEAKIYTNDAKLLPLSIERENLKQAAMDLRRERQRA